MPTLQELVDALGPELVAAPIAPHGLAVPFTRAVVHDALDPDDLQPHDLVLAVGVPAESGQLLRLLQPGPAAVVLRSERRLPDRVLAEAASTGVAVLTVVRSCSWGQLHEVIVTMPDRAVPPTAGSLTGTELDQDLFAIANALADRVSAPVTIEDNQSRLLAYSARHEGADAARSATILGHRVPEAYRREVRRLGVAKRLLTETKPFHLVSQLPDISSRMVVPIRARGEVLGSVWALADKPFDRGRARAFAAAAESIAVRLLHHRLRSHLQRQQQAAVVTGLLSGAPEQGYRDDLSGVAFRVLAIRRRDTSTPDNHMLEGCWMTLSMQLSLSSSTALSAQLGDTVYCVLPVPAEPERSLGLARQLCNDLRAALDDTRRRGLVIGVSGHAASAAELPGAREEADRVAQVLASKAGPWCAELDEVGLQVTLLRLADLEARREPGSQDPLSAVESYDAEHGTHYLDTLRVYLSAFGDPAMASARLGVHTNTLRYRVRRLDEIFGLDLLDEDVRFGLLLRLRLRST